MRSKLIERVGVAGGDYYIARWPGNGPTMLAVHGITASHFAFRISRGRRSAMRCTAITPYSRPIFVDVA